jgi:hypothetical protein
LTLCGAGYNAGETGIPVKTPTRDVQKDFGAKGDGRTDDSRAFARAFDSMKDGDVLRIPAGKYVLTQSFRLTKSFSIKGDGSDKVRGAQSLKCACTIEDFELES